MDTETMMTPTQKAWEHYVFESLPKWRGVMDVGVGRHAAERTAFEAGWMARGRVALTAPLAGEPTPEARLEAILADQDEQLKRIRATMTGRAVETDMVTRALVLSQRDRIGIAAHQPIRGLGWCRMCKEDSPCLVERLAALLGVREPTR